MRIHKSSPYCVLRQFEWSSTHFVLLLSCSKNFLHDLFIGACSCRMAFHQRRSDFRGSLLPFLMSTSTASTSVVVTPAERNTEWTLQGITPYQIKTSNLQSDSFPKIFSVGLPLKILHSACFSVVTYPAHSHKYHSLNLRERKWNCAQLQLQSFNLTTKGMSLEMMLSGIHPNGWCKMLCCLATCLIICRRDLTEACSEGCSREYCVCMCVYMPLTISIQYAAWGLVPTGHRLSQSGWGERG